MINFPIEAKYTYLKESDTAKKCMEMLEKTLRNLGSFNEKKPIEIKKYHSGETYLDTIYLVEDLDETVFKFNNFNFGTQNNYGQRFNKNYHLTMKRKNSNFSFKYDFSKVNSSNHNQELNMIEVSYQLTENIVLKLKRPPHQPIVLVMQEKDKEYTMVFLKHEEENEKLILENFERIIKNASKIKEVNLENFLKIVENEKNISLAYISENNRIITSVTFKNGEIYNYKIREPRRKVEVTFSDKIMRNIENIGSNSVIKNTQEIKDEDYEVLAIDYNKLFKRI